MDKNLKRKFLNYKNISLKKLQEQLCHNIRIKIMQRKYNETFDNNYVIEFPNKILNKKTQTSYPNNFRLKRN